VASRPRLPESLRDSVRSTAKEAIWLTVRHRPGDKRNICLFCTRRGGSTWLMEVIAANRGVLPLNQPIEIVTPNLTPYQFRRYTDDLMAGRIRVNAPVAFWRKGFRFRTDRLLLKITGGKPMMDWFDTNYPVDVVYLVRHPVPQSLSCIRNGWPTTTKIYLRNEWFVETVLADPALRDYAESIDRTGSELERFVVNWVVENLYSLQVLPQRPQWVALSYEECVVDQARVFTEVCRRLELTDIDRMRAASTRESRSSSLSSAETVSAIKSGDRQEQISGWRKRISPEDEKRVAEILDRFGVTLYSATDPLPNWTAYQSS
jgi:hypothetical protein